MLVTRALGFRRGQHPVVSGVDVDVAAGEVVGIVGPNGSGKTTLMRLLYGSLAPSEGEIRINGRPTDSYRRSELARMLSVVVQEPGTENPISVADLVMLGRLPYRTGREENEAIVVDALRRVGMLKAATTDFTHLSGGERQRVLIARALAQQARIMILDEPTNHLDIHFQHEAMHLVRAVVGDDGDGVGTGRDRAAIVVLHDLNLAARYCDRVYVLHDGVVAAHGRPSEVLVPEVLEPVYNIRVRVGEVDGAPSLVFSRR
ncbi:ABC transporter ATP-binding protein [Corynebacterium uterequi]|uniref:ABC-type cobalamin/Fe3+-siderophore transport system, ATPase component n=1 Tax=Corynebacterium uterequi TaxID=1072256 RepID=A0A0G3HGB8_9CORY|nr:ABC transporter ATP-binding protein [Corynebacterium uterequi]AKK10157.1 ABC-type cobalamin/Fe3+-siderophore transport system, ATPase component [Corynebacterium uterequi]